MGIRDIKYGILDMGYIGNMGYGISDILDMGYEMWDIYIRITHQNHHPPF
jgi:hypothetical protein